MKEITKTNAAIQEIDDNKIKSYLQTMNLIQNLTEHEVQQFMEISRAFQLNPFKREIYASKYGDQFAIIIGFEVYIKRAERSGQLLGWSVTTEGEFNSADFRKSTLKGVITIHRVGWSVPFVHEVHFMEYAGIKRDGTLNKFWKEKPITMIKKVSIAQGFRLCFSDELGGLPYTKEELGDINPEIDLGKVTIIQPNEKVDQVTPKTKAKAKQEPPVIDGNPGTMDSLSEKYEIALKEIDQASTIEDLKRIYDANVFFNKDEEFVGRLSIKRREIEGKK
jgi:phage recombination protein Bet